MSIWGWIVVAVGVIVWALVGLMAFLLWVLREDEDEKCRWFHSMPFMLVVCGPGVWVFTGYAAINHWWRHRGNNKHK